MSDVMALVPEQMLREIEAFISHHRGITFAEAEPAVNALRKYRTEGIELFKQFELKKAQET